MQGNIIKKRLMSYSRYWTGTSLQWRLMRGNIINKRLMSYSRYWTGTSLQWRLMWGILLTRDSCHIPGIRLKLVCNGGSCGGISLKRD